MPKINQIKTKQFKRDLYFNTPTKLVTLSLLANTSDRLLAGYGREAPHNQFHDGTHFCDAATGLIWAENQSHLELEIV